MRTIKHGDLGSATVGVDAELKRYAGSNGEWPWRFRVLKAQILDSQLACSNALTVLRGELPLSLAGTDLAVRKPMFEGIAYRICQDFHSSERALASAEDVATTSHPQLLPQVLVARGALEVDERKYDSADSTYRRALTIARRQGDSDQEVSALVSLARLAMSQERFDEAVDRGQAALQLSRSLDVQSLVATTLGNLGWSYFELGDFDNALDYYQQAADSSERLNLPGYRLYWVTGVANSYSAKQDYAKAEELLLETLDSVRAQGHSQTITEYLNDLTEIMLKTGRVQAAQQYNRQAIELQDAGSEHLGIVQSRLLAGRIAAQQTNPLRAEKLLRAVVDDREAETPLRWQAEASLAKLWEGQQKFAEADREYQTAIETIEKARSSIDHDELRLSFLSSGIEVYGEYIDFLIRRNRANDALHQADLSRARTLAEGLSPKIVASSQPTPRANPQQLAQRLRATILVYWLGEKHSYLWAITPTKTEYFTLPRASEIDPLIKNYRDLTLKSADVLASPAEAGKKLYTTLLEPAKKLLPPGSRVILLPDASLYGLNFETLIVPDPQPHFWIEDVTVTTASSLSMLASAANRPPSRQKSLLLVGDAVPVPEFGPLPQAATEIQKIQPYFPQTRRTVLQGPQATPSAYLKSQPGRFSYLHFVTHGTASRARPLESAVILSKEPGGESYKLYAREIVAHPLRADLVTISACNGSGTRAYSGEGLVGLSWAFVRAGAHNVIGALWEVSDVSTPQLMDKMYAQLAAGKDPATALRNAKLALLHAHNVFAKPFYWAPFQLYSGS